MITTYIETNGTKKIFEGIPNRAYAACGVRNESYKGLLYLHYDNCLTPIYAEDGKQIRLTERAGMEFNKYTNCWRRA